MRIVVVVAVVELGAIFEEIQVVLRESWGRGMEDEK